MNAPATNFVFWALILILAITAVFCFPAAVIAFFRWHRKHPGLTRDIRLFPRYLVTRYSPVRVPGDGKRLTRAERAVFVRVLRGWNKTAPEPYRDGTDREGAA